MATNYAASATITISPQNVASSATFVAGVESDVVSNATTKYDDVLVSGLWTCGTTPTSGTQCVIYVGAARDDGPTYPDVFDGTASAETLTSAGVGQGFLIRLAIINIDSATSNVGYPVGPVSLRALFGSVPRNWFLFITHNSGVNSNSTAGNHVWKFDGITVT